MSDLKETAAVNAANIDNLKDDVAEVKSLLYQTNDKLDNLRVSHAKMLGAIGGSGMLGGVAGAAGVKYLPIAAMPAVHAVQSGVVDSIFMLIGPLLAFLGYGIYKKIMAGRGLKLQPPVLKDNNAFRQERLAKLDDDREAELQNQLAQPPTDLEALLVEAEDLRARRE